MPTSSGQSSPIPQLGPFQLNMSDDALVTFGAPTSGGGVAFHDTGYMPVNEVTVSGIPLDHPPGNGNLFIQYSGDGVQYFNNSGQPTTAVYSDLHYELVEYNGAGSFQHAADGTPTADGVGNPVVLAQGDLDAGQLTFNPDGGITGEVTGSFLTDGQTVGTLDISVQHSASDIGYFAGGLTLDGGSLQATYTPLSGS